MVLRGADDWLFLHNDGNKSVEQYVGDVGLSAADLARWDEYFRSLISLRASLGFKAVQLFAPAKESVYEDFYPHRARRAAVRPIDALLERVPPELPVLYPVDLLRPMEGRPHTYDKGDSHWNAVGGAVAAVAALQMVGCDLPDPLSLGHWEAERFGDLDSKVEASPLGKRIFPPKHRRTVVKTFDSQCENHGMVMVYANAGAPERSLLLLGDSFANSIQLLLAPCFSRIVRVHRHSLDPGILEMERPDYVLCVMAERFIIRPPPSPEVYDMRGLMRRKFSEMPAEELERVRAEYAAALNGPERRWAEFLAPALP